MPWSERERDPQSFVKVLTAFDGRRYALDIGSAKVLSFMLERPEGCDATLSPDRFEIRFGWHLSRHRYFLVTAPAIVSRLLDLAGAETGARRVRGLIGPGAIPVMPREGSPPQGGLAAWSFGVRRLWMDASEAEVIVRIRSPGVDDVGAEEMPPSLPEPLEFPLTVLEYPSPFPCPHCATPSRTFRQLQGGYLVCAACGRSFTLGDA